MNVELNEAKQALQEISKEVLRPAYKPKKYRKIISYFPDEIWSLDLVLSYEQYKEKNKGYKYILVCIDLFTRYVWSVEQKDKTPFSTWTSFQHILDTCNESNHQKPQFIFIDQGSEWKGNFAERLRYKNIKSYHVFNEKKASIVERVIRSLNQILWKILFIHQSRKWIMYLQEAVHIYNNRKHRTIGMSPVEASKLDEHEQKELFTKLFGNETDFDEPKFKIDDWVRISVTKGLFEKGYHLNWTMEKFKIYKIRQGSPPMYYIEDALNEKVDGGFYENELQLTTNPYDSIAPIEKIISGTRRRATNPEDGSSYYEVEVKWLGIPEKFNSFIPEDAALVI